MKIYAISGLGADERVFERLSLHTPIIPIAWIDPLKNESLESYALRMAEVIDLTEDFTLLGVSFGGLIATEMAKKINPILTILISSVEVCDELSIFIRAFGKTSLGTVLPSKGFTPPSAIAHFLFGAENKSLLTNILKDSDPYFTKWAINALLHWKNNQRLEKVMKICGSNDKIMPPTKDENTVLIPGGQHFMIVDRAGEISKIINDRLLEIKTPPED